MLWGGDTSCNKGGGLARLNGNSPTFISQLHTLRHGSNATDNNKDRKRSSAEDNSRKDLLHLVGRGGVQWRAMRRTVNGLVGLNE